MHWTKTLPENDDKLASYFVRKPGEQDRRQWWTEQLIDIKHDLSKGYIDNYEFSSSPIPEPGEVIECELCHGQIIGNGRPHTTCVMCYVTNQEKQESEARRGEEESK